MNIKTHTCSVKVCVYTVQSVKITLFLSSMHSCVIQAVCILLLSRQFPTMHCRETSCWGNTLCGNSLLVLL